MSTEETSGQEDSAARPPGRHSIPPGTDAEANNGDPEYHLNGTTLFSDVLAPNTSNRRALRQMGVVLTNVVYDGVLLPDRNEGQEELNQSLRLFLKKPSVRLADLVVTTILTVGTSLAVAFHRQYKPVVSMISRSILSRSPTSSDSPIEAPSSARLKSMRSTVLSKTPGGMGSDMDLNLWKSSTSQGKAIWWLTEEDGL